MLQITDQGISFVTRSGLMARLGPTHGTSLSRATDPTHVKIRLILTVLFLGRKTPVSTSAT